MVNLNRHSNDYHDQGVDCGIHRDALGGAWANIIVLDRLTQQMAEEAYANW
jgi:hypothetical protein